MNPDKLFDYLEGKLSPAERGQLEEKLMSDPQLRREFNIAREIHRAGGGSREVIVPSDDPATVEKRGKLGRAIATGVIILVFGNVAVGLLVIAGKNKNKSNLNTKEAQMREQLEVSLGAAAEKALPPPSFKEDIVELTAPRAEWDQIADQITSGATAFGGSAAKGLREDNLQTVLVDVPTSREAEFRHAITSAARISPMPAIAPGVRQDAGQGDDKGDRTIVQVRISEAAP